MVCETILKRRGYMRYLFLILFSVLLFIGCQPAIKKPVADANAKRYPLKGKVVSVDLEKQKVTIQHEKVENYMDAMTMPFPLYDKDILQTMTKGSEVKAELIVNSDGDYWLENVVISAAPTANQTIPAINDNFAQIDKEVPDFKLTNQDGKPVSFKDFRGKALAITFIYSRCPLPEYCILMSRRFSDLAIQLNNSADLKDKVRLLSISFDPATDTPETLKKYGIAYIKNPNYDFTIWQLATAPDADVRKIADFFGLRYEVDASNKAIFNHSLRTVVIAPDGKVKKVFSGGDWTNDELLRELETTLK
ncbi:MAG: SCO family protein [Pyrinomonadaceae bacterium]|nr:SCO family protein [Pyrinomonadaceae bacterium]